MRKIVVMSVALLALAPLWALCFASDAPAPGSRAATGQTKRRSANDTRPMGSDAQGSPEHNSQPQLSSSPLRSSPLRLSNRLQRGPRLRLPR